MIELLSFFKLKVSHCLIPCNCCEECIDKCVRVPLAALACESTVIETGKLEHLPYSRVTPVIWFALRPNANVEVVVATFENAGHRPLTIPIEANHVLSQILEGLIESFLVVFGLTFAEADQPS